MIAVSMLDDQDLPVAAEGAGELDATIERCDDVAAGWRANENSLARGAEFVALAIATLELAGDRQEHRATRRGEGTQVRRPGWIDLSRHRRRAIQRQGFGCLGIG